MAVVAAPLLAACGGDEGSGPPTLNWYIGAQAGGWIENAISNCNEQAAGRYRIQFQELPARATDQREQLVRRLGANDASIDVIGMDVIWTAEFANAGWIAPFPEEMRAELTEGVLQGPLESGTYEGKLYAVPFTSNTQLLWYRNDLVEDPPPDFTWADMIADAEAKNLQIQIQGARAESLTVTFNALLASAGGSFLNEDGSISLEQGPTSRALEVLKNFATSPASSPELNTAQEDSSRSAFEQGQSGYQINYPFIYPSAADVTTIPDFQSKISWTRYPRVNADTPSRPPLGGFNLGVGEFSDNKDLAFEAAACLRSAENQLFAAENGGNPPTLESVYDQLSDETYPFKDVLRESINDAEPRPVSPAYNTLSLAVQNVLHPLGAINPEADARELRELAQKSLNSEAVLT